MTPQTDRQTLHIQHGVWHFTEDESRAQQQRRKSPGSRQQRRKGIPGNGSKDGSGKGVGPTQEQQCLRFQFFFSQTRQEEVLTNKQKFKQEIVLSDSRFPKFWVRKRVQRIRPWKQLIQLRSQASPLATQSHQTWFLSTETGVSPEHCQVCSPQLKKKNGAQKVV